MVIILKRTSFDRNDILVAAEERNANRDRTFKSPKHSPLNGSDLNLAAKLNVFFLLERRLRRREGKLDRLFLASRRSFLPAPRRRRHGDQASHWVKRAIVQPVLFQLDLLRFTLATRANIPFINGHGNKRGVCYRGEQRE